MQNKKEIKRRTNELVGIIKNSLDPIAKSQALNELIILHEHTIRMIMLDKYNTFIRQYEDELVQEGRIAIMENAEKYDPDLGEFSTYISKFVHGKMRQRINFIQKLTPHQQSNLKKLTDAIAELDMQNGSAEAQSVRSLAKKMGVGVNAATQALETHQRLYETSYADYHEGLQDPTRPEDLIVEKDLIRTLYAAVNQLPFLEKQAIVTELEMPYGNDAAKAKHAGMSLDNFRKYRRRGLGRLKVNHDLRQQVSQKAKPEKRMKDIEIRFFVNPEQEIRQEYFN